MKKNIIITLLLVLVVSVMTIVDILSQSADNYGEPRSSEVRPNPPQLFASTVIEGADTTEEVIDTGMENTIVVVSFHLYETYAELNFDYNTVFKEPDEPEQELWGFSNCEWQPEANAAFCDIYTIRPQFVHSDMAIDTIGHEVWHGVAGPFHDE